MSQLDLALLGPPRALPLEPNDIAKLISRFGPFWQLVWGDVAFLAGECWQAQDEDDDERKRITWHHLALAVGNFKRSAGTMLPLGNLLLPEDLGQRRSTFDVPGVLCLRQCDPESWRELTAKIRGIEVPTASALLAALWPSSHAILDVRVGIALFALTAGLEGKIPEELDCAGTIPPRDWDFYDRYRGFVLESVRLANRTGSCEPFQIERALYLLDEAVRSQLTIKLRHEGRRKDEWRWSEYVDALKGELPDVAVKPRQVKTDRRSPPSTRGPVTLPHRPNPS